MSTAFRLILAIPHLVVLALRLIALFVVGAIAFFAVLFTGRWPGGPGDFAVGVGHWWLRVQAYLALIDEYPRGHAVLRSPRRSPRRATRSSEG